MYRTSSDYFAANNTEMGEEFTRLARLQNREALTTLNIQYCCEVIVLLLIVTAFAAVGVACARLINSALALLGPHKASALSPASKFSEAGRKLKLQVVGTCPRP